MTSLLRTAALAATALFSGLAHGEDARLHELRIYHSPPGKRDALLERFRDHTCALFEKHGMTNGGYWIPADAADERVLYLLSYPGRPERDAAWKAFLADPEWKAVVAESEKDGKLVEKIEETFLKTTPFSPGFPETSPTPRLWELRTYRTEPGRLPALHARFRDHTMGLFSKHGMTNAAYFQPTTGQPGADDTLIYFLAHKDAPAAEKSWTEIRADPVWVAAKKASEDAAGGSLTVPDGVTSVFLKPVDFSKLK